MKGFMLDVLGIVGVGLIVWALADVDVRLARAFAGAVCCALALRGARAAAEARE